MKKELNEKHLGNLKVLAAADKGMLRDKMPHPRHIQLLVNRGLAEVTGRDWCSRVYITQEGRSVLVDA